MSASSHDRFGRMKVTLAVRNLLHSKGQLSVSLFGIIFATLLMGVQGSLLSSFTRAASRIVDAVDADLVIVGKGTPTFEYVSPIPDRYAFLALGVDGVQDAGRGILGWAPIQLPNGDRTLVLLVGIERGFRGNLPSVFDLAAEQGRSDWALAIDTADAQTLHFSNASRLVQVGAHRGYFVGTINGFSSFIGSPYVFANFVDARRYLGLDDTQVSMLLLRSVPGKDPIEVRDAVRTRLPDVDVWTKSELSQRSRMFWLLQTGAGAALSLAAVLGFCIGLVLVAQTIYSITAENIEEYATMKAMGASNSDVRGVVLIQSLICGVIGGTVGLALIEPFSVLVRPVVTWIAVPSWIYPAVGVAIILLCITASLIAARPAVSIDPARVFRA
jgi:putative ABC transport system permease protein